MKKKILFVLLIFASFASLCSGVEREFVLVIDAGHGGRDYGAPGTFSHEKFLTLRYALAFGKMVERNCPDVKVIYTRINDRFLELWQRAEIANKNKADLFISVHINALAGGRVARGFQTYTLGKGDSGKGVVKNLEVAKRENAVILLEKDYKQIYKGFDPNSSESNIIFEFIQDQNMERSVELAKYMQKSVCAATGRQDMGAHQANLAVLRLTSMPGCLVELGFISTLDEEQFLNSDAATDLYAKGLFNAFAQYKDKFYGGNTRTFVVEKPQNTLSEVNAEDIKTRQEPTTEPTQNTKVTEPEPQTTTKKTARGDNAPVFKVQILACSKAVKAGDPRLKGLENVEYFMENGLTKYTVGASTDYNEIYRLRKSLLEQFPQAFIIAFRNGQKMDVAQAVNEFKSNKK